MALSPSPRMVTKLGGYLMGWLRNMLSLMSAPLRFLSMTSVDGRDGKCLPTT